MADKNIPNQMRTRFAPSPTGYLHLGHAYSAMLAHDRTRAAGGTFLLRIEDTDTGRCKPEYEVGVYEDLKWLGLAWQTPVIRQSERLTAYQKSLNALTSQGICYPCNCSRRDIREAATAPQGNSATGPLYPGTCRTRPMDARTDTDAIRLNVALALEKYPEIAGLIFNETCSARLGQHTLTTDRILTDIGDIVLARRDIRSASYHLCVVVDDAAQNITHIIRGEDLFAATFVHRLLQHLLNLPTPTYHHHRLIRDGAGKRLAKRDNATAIRTLRDAGQTPAQIRALVGL